MTGHDGVNWKDKLVVQVKNLTLYAAVLGTLVLVVGNRVDTLKSQFNNAAEQRCIRHAPRVSNYNTLVATLRNQQLTAEHLNLRAHDAPKAAADAAYAAQFKDLKDAPDDCSIPLIP